MKLLEMKIYNNIYSKTKSELKPMFYQTYKSCLVNLDNVREIDYSTSTIYFKNGDTTNLIALQQERG